MLPAVAWSRIKNHPGRKLARPRRKRPTCRRTSASGASSIPVRGERHLSDRPNARAAKTTIWKSTSFGKTSSPRSAAIRSRRGNREISLLTIADKDAISDNGVEIWNLLEAAEIKNVVLLGVHTNMCVLGRPFGLRQMAKNGKNVVLMRDMTDTMYDPAKWPYVNHFTGTRLIVEHIEKFVCPTITSVDFLGGEPFRFSRDRRNIAMLIGDDEYKTEVTLPAFAKSDLEPLGFDVTIVHADSQDKNSFPGMAEAIRKADVVLVSARRRLPPKADLDALREHIAAGKPVVGIRTACHAWCLRTEKDNAAAAAAGRGVWPEFDPEVFGGHYTNHYGDGPKTAIAVADGAKDHAILRGIELDKLVGNGSLYKVKPLTDTTTPLLDRHDSRSSSRSRSPGPTSPGRRRPACSTRRSAISDDFDEPAVPQAAGQRPLLGSRSRTRRARISRSCCRRR